MRDAEQKRAERHVIGAEARAHQRIRDRPEQGLEARLEIVDGGQFRPAP